MSHLSWHDLQWCLRRAPRPVLDLMKEQGPKLMVAGGFIRSCVAGETVNDIDLFAPSRELAEQFARTLAGESRIHESGNAYTVTNCRVAVQIIHRWTFDDPATMLDSFDFTIAKAAFWWDGENWRSLCDPRFYQDLAAKRLVYTNPQRNEDAGGSLLRVLKFYQRGYRIPLDSLGAVIARLSSGVDDERMNAARSLNPDRVLTHEQLTAKVITGLLREVDPAIDPSHAAHLPAESDEVQQ